jgi:flagellar hook assembly protein FlgD
VEGPQADALPTKYALHPNFPNPFNPSTTIKYDLKEAGKVSLKIYNVLGQEVRTLVSGAQTAGFKNIAWDGRNNAGQAVSSGIYVYRLETSGFVKSRKMMLIK